MAGHESPAAVVLLPMIRDPHGGRVWPLGVVARYPLILIAAPLPISRLPDIGIVGRRRDIFRLQWRRGPRRRLIARGLGLGAWDLIALRIHALHVSVVVLLLEVALGALGAAGADGRAGNGARGRADRSTLASADGGAQSGAEDRADDRGADRLIVRLLCLSADLLVGILLAGGLIRLKLIEGLIGSGHDGHARPLRGRGAAAKGNGGGKAESHERSLVHQPCPPMRRRVIRQGHLDRAVT